MHAIVNGLRERPGGRVEIELDGAAWRMVPLEAAVRCSLAVGLELDEQRLERELQRLDALARAARALVKTDRPRAAIAERLERAGVELDVTREVLGTLERAGVLDDRRFAARRAEHLAAKGWGDGAIRADLERQGVDVELAAEALEGLDPEQERARALAAGGRSARWLAARGFDEGSIESAVVRFAEEA